MSIGPRTRRRSKAQKTSKGTGIFGFSVSKDRIQSLVSELPDHDRVTVITRGPIAGSTMRAARLQPIDLSELSDDTLSVLVEGNASKASTGDDSIDHAAFEPDARARAMLRGVDIAESDLAAAGGAYDLEQVKRLMHGLSRQRIERRVRDGSLLAVPGPSNRRRYPTIQFNSDGTIVEGLQAVRKALDFSSPWSMLSFLIHPDQRLQNQRPIDVLRQGSIASVVESARRVGVQGG